VPGRTGPMWLLILNDNAVAHSHRLDPFCNGRYLKLGQISAPAVWRVTYRGGLGRDSLISPNILVKGCSYVTEGKARRYARCHSCACAG
jgi:hypothetical protein